MASNLVAEWKTAKKEFEKVTGEKRPKESFLKVFTKDSGIEPALKKCDDLANTATKDIKADTAAKLRAATKDLQKKVADYIVLLDKAIAAEPAKNDMYRALKALKARTDKFGPHYEVAALELSKNPMDLMNAAGMPLLKKTLASALADCQRVLAKPDWQTYDAVMGSGNGIGRKLTTAIKAAGGAIDEQAYKARLDPYATGNKMTMNAKATRDDVTREIKAFQAIVKEIIADLP